MPIIQENTNQKTQYFKLKSFEFQKDFYSKKIAVKEPAFVIWDGEKEVEVGQTFKGNLYEINLGEPKEITTKTGAKLELMDIYLEFRSLDKNQNLIKEVVVLTYPSTLFEKTVQKLAGVRNFKDLKINVGQYTLKNSEKKKDYVTIFEGNKKLPNIINFKSTNSEYPDPEGLIEIPPIEWIEVEGEKPTVHPQWKAKLKKLYWEEFLKIKKRLEEFKKENYGEEFAKLDIQEEIVEIDNIDTEEEASEPAYIAEDTAPQLTDEELNEAFNDNGSNMPF